MRWLLDTQLLLWASGETTKLPRAARRLLSDADADLWFSAASIWEVAIKSALGRADFLVDANRLRRGLVANGWRELVITSEHAAATLALPQIHKDPFDRLLLAQAQVESLPLLTTDELVAKYPCPVRRV